MLEVAELNDYINSFFWGQLRVVSRVSIVALFKARKNVDNPLHMGIIACCCMEIV
jgi:hypothetical protein